MGALCEPVGAGNVTAGPGRTAEPYASGNGCGGGAFCVAAGVLLQPHNTTHNTRPQPAARV